MVRKGSCAVPRAPLLLLAAAAPPAHTAFAAVGGFRALPKLQCAGCSSTLPQNNTPVAITASSDGVESLVTVAGARAVVAYTLVEAPGHDNASSWLWQLERPVTAMSAAANVVAVAEADGVQFGETVHESHRDKWIILPHHNLSGVAAAASVSVAFCQDVSTVSVAVASYGTGLHIGALSHAGWTLSDGRLLPNGASRPYVSACCDCISGHWWLLAAAAGDALVVLLVNKLTAKLSETEAVSPPLRGHATSVATASWPGGPQGEALVAVAASGALQLFAAGAAGLRELQQPAPRSPRYVLCVAGALGTVAAGTSSGTITLFSVSPQEQVAEAGSIASAFSSAVAALAYDLADGDLEALLAAASASGEARAWRVLAPPGAAGVGQWAAPAAVVGSVAVLVFLVCIPVWLLRRRGWRETPPERVGLILSGGSEAAAAEVGKQAGASGQYEMVRELGRGAHGAVYLARSRQDGKLFALKHIFSAAMTGDRALAEFRLLRDLYEQHSHPGLVRVHEVFMRLSAGAHAAPAAAPSSPGSAQAGGSSSRSASAGRSSGTSPTPAVSPSSGLSDGQQHGAAAAPAAGQLQESAGAAGGRCITVPPDSVCIVMDYYPGGDLAGVLRHHGQVPMSEATLLGWGRQLLSVLAYLHAQAPPLVHRDLKPENILVADSGALVVADFGLAKHICGDSGTHSSVGTLAYVAPECVRGRYGSEVDVWACGCVLFAAATGQHGPRRRVLFLDAERRGARFLPQLAAELTRAGQSVGFAAWLCTLLDPAPRSRSTAAGALAALPGAAGVPLSVMAQQRQQPQQQQQQQQQQPAPQPPQLPPASSPSEWDS